MIPSAAHVQIHAAAILKRSDVGARASTSALVFRQLRAAGKQMQCVRCAQHNIVWLWLDGTTVVTIHIHHGAHATCVDKQPPENESMSARKKVCCRLPSHEDSLKHTRLRGDWHRTVFKRARCSWRDSGARRRAGARRQALRHERCTCATLRH